MINIHCPYTVYKISSDLLEKLIDNHLDQFTKNINENSSESENEKDLFELNEKMKEVKSINEKINFRNVSKGMLCIRT